jgi:hypothetical protein
MFSVSIMKRSVQNDQTSNYMRRPAMEGKRFLLIFLGGVTGLLMGWLTLPMVRADEFAWPPWLHVCLYGSGFMLMVAVAVWMAEK